MYDDKGRMAWTGKDAFMAFLYGILVGFNLCAILYEVMG